MKYSRVDSNTRLAVISTSNQSARSLVAVDRDDLLKSLLRVLTYFLNPTSHICNVVIGLYLQIMDEQSTNLSRVISFVTER